jgi:DNA-binding NarL/FixJ family response regulator
MIDITIHLDKALKTEIEYFFKSKGMNLNSGIVYILSDFLVKGQTKILTEKMDYYKLSPREKEIVIHLCKGIQIKEICAKLFISVHTIRNHIRHVYIKCGVQNKIELFLKLTGLTCNQGKAL